MLGENIKTLRKQKGYSQEILAEQLNVVRQTVSKWEKGLSVPDAEMLSKIAELFEIPVSDLLGSRISESDSTTESNEVAKQLAILNEQLARQSRNRKRILKIILLSIAALILITIAVYAAAFSIFKFEHTSSSLTSVEMHCTLNDAAYAYGITYDDQYRIIAAGGDAWIANHVQTEQYNDANILIAQVEDYFTDRGGACVLSEDDQ
jgi:transcriptional regulator with XRE-family HTH domain